MGSWITVNTRREDNIPRVYTILTLCLNYRLVFRYNSAESTKTNRRLIMKKDEVIIAYDINSTPVLNGYGSFSKQETLIQVLDYFKEEGVLLYSSTQPDGLPANEPKVFKGELAKNIKIVEYEEFMKDSAKTKRK